MEQHKDRRWALETGKTGSCLDCDNEVSGFCSALTYPVNRGCRDDYCSTHFTPRKGPRNPVRAGVVTMIAAAVASALALAAPARAAASVPADKLDQAARCAIYLSFANTEVEASAMLVTVTAGMNERDEIRVTVRALELMNVIGAMSDAEAGRAVETVLSEWRPNCVAAGVLGAMQ